MHGRTLSSLSFEELCHELAEDSLQGELENLETPPVSQQYVAPVGQPPASVENASTTKSNYFPEGTVGSQPHQKTPLVPLSPSGLTLQETNVPKNETDAHSADPRLFSNVRLLNKRKAPNFVKEITPITNEQFAAICHKLGSKFNKVTNKNFLNAVLWALKNHDIFENSFQYLPSDFKCRCGRPSYEKFLSWINRGVMSDIFDIIEVEADITENYQTFLKEYSARCRKTKSLIENFNTKSTDATVDKDLLQEIVDEHTVAPSSNIFPPPALYIVDATFPPTPSQKKEDHAFSDLVIEQPPVPPQVMKKTISDLPTPQLHTSEHTIESIAVALPQLKPLTAFPVCSFTHFQPQSKSQPKPTKILHPTKDITPLTDAEFDLLKSILPKMVNETREQQRNFVNAAFWVLKNHHAFTDIAFNHLPEKFGSALPKINHERFVRWVNKGLILKIFATIKVDPEIEGNYTAFLAAQEKRMLIKPRPLQLS